MTNRREMPNWRSMLFVPATSERFRAKAHQRGADVIILDLEDAIPPGQKTAARDALAVAVPEVGQGGAAVCVRVNRPLELTVPDIDAAIAAGATSLLFPKVMDAGHIRLLAELAEAAEARHGRPLGSTLFQGIIETPEAMPHAHAIAAAHPRMVTLSLGGEDFSTELEAVPDFDALYVPAMQVLIAARAAGILPAGSVGAFAAFDDLERYRLALRRSRRLGFAVASCIHPAQVPVINEEYGPSDAEVDRARRLIVTFEEALAQSKGAVAFEGAMIDLPVVERARRLLRRAR